MTLGEVVNLFRCDSPEILEYVENPNAMWPNGEQNSLILYTDNTFEYEFVRLPNYGELIRVNDEKLYLSYCTNITTPDNQNGDCILSFILQNNVVIEMSVEYGYDKYSDFKAIVQSNQDPVHLIDFSNITLFGRSISEVFSSDITSVMDSVIKIGYPHLRTNDDWEDDHDHWWFSAYDNDFKNHISGLQDYASSYINLISFGELGYPQSGKIGIGDIDMSDSLSTVLSKWGFADGERMAEYLLAFTGTPTNEFYFAWNNDDIDNYGISIIADTYFFDVEEAVPFNGDWILTFMPNDHEGITLTFRFNNDSLVEFNAHKE